MINRVPEVRVSVVRERCESVNATLLCRDSDSAAALFKAYYPLDDEKERVVLFLLDNKHRLKGVHLVSIGTINESIVKPREVFRVAIVAGACAIVLAHNHPSGSVSPSVDDYQVTERLVECGKLIGIPLVDHVIVTEHGEIYSFSKNGLT